MLKKKTTDIENWIREYTGSLYGIDENVDINIELKTLHTFKVAAEMGDLCDDIGLIDDEKDIAVIIGLLHDCGRFEQIVKYKTFDDTKSENHALLGLRVIKQNHILDDIDPAAARVIEEAIRNHNAMKIEISPGSPGQAILYARMIRDADKLDIFRVVQLSYQQYIRDPANANTMALNFGSDTGQCSPEVLDELMARRQIGYEKLKTLDDRKLLQLCWVYDINFPPVLRKIVNRGYIQMIFNALPRTPQMDEAKAAIKAYISEILPARESDLH
jgi:hypothetical protein